MSARKRMNFTEDDVRNAIRSKCLVVKTGKLKSKENPWITDNEARLIHTIRMILYATFKEIDLDEICGENKNRKEKLTEHTCKLLSDCNYLHKPGRVSSPKKMRRLWAEFICGNKEIARLRMDNAKAEREEATKRVMAKYQKRLNALRQSNKPVDEINKGVCEIVYDRDQELSCIQQIGLDEKNPTELEEKKQ